MNEEIVFHPIGVIHSPYNPDTGAPRQGILMPDEEASIEIYEPFQEALKTLNEFEYILVFFYFDQVKSWKPIVNPSGSTDEHEFGLFSTRSPRRPNPIGFCLVKLDRIEKGVLYIRGIDAFEGTPVLDIKPYLPSVDCVESSTNRYIEKELGLHDEDIIDDSGVSR
ncbi:MAG: tRNA (N6-threonylcarbamoyladenosine(37)-N6)-methyltransferase TrmO [Bacteroidales bacterium]|nr:tRNA (N6-threonylcarbamoyladenosine(37)-N6)-methyltransferase TrmO [Bacteroidales bacterium]